MSRTTDALRLHFSSISNSPSSRASQSPSSYCYDSSTSMKRTRADCYCSRSPSLDSKVARSQPASRALHLSCLHPRLPRLPLRCPRCSCCSRDTVPRALRPVRGRGVAGARSLRRASRSNRRNAPWSPSSSKCFGSRCLGVAQNLE